MDDIYEWEFPKPSHLVDLERICMEVNGVPTFLALMYMRNLFEKAPIVYNRLKIWAIKNNQMNWHNWFDNK